MYLSPLALFKSVTEYKLMFVLFLMQDLKLPNSLNSSIPVHLFTANHCFFILYSSAHIKGSQGVLRLNPTLHIAQLWMTKIKPHKLTTHDLMFYSSSWLYELSEPFTSILNHTMQRTLPQLGVFDIIAKPAFIQTHVTTSRGVILHTEAENAHGS